MRRVERGFTLVELLVVIAIIGILMSMLVPAVNVVRQGAQRTKCANNLHNLMVAMQNYESQKGVFPPGRVGCDSDEQWPCLDKRTKQPLLAYQRPSSSGFSQILPELDEAELFRLLRFEKGGISPVPDSSTTGWQNLSSNSISVAYALQRRPQVMVCPSDRGGTLSWWYGIGMATGSYAMCMGSKGPSFYNRLGPHEVNYNNNGVFIYYLCRRSAEIERGDGLTNTIFLGEARDGNNGNHSNCWPMGIRLGDSLRSTENSINSKWGWGSVREPHPTAQNSFRYLYGVFYSYHSGGANFAFGDGHVQFLTDVLDLSVYRRLGTYNGSYDYLDSTTKPPDVEQ